MDRSLEKRDSERVVELGRKGDPAAMPELVAFTKSPSALVRRLAASAMGKLAGLVDASAAVTAIQPLLHDIHPQTRQYAIKALTAFGKDSIGALSDLRDISVNPAEKDYNRRDAVKAIEVITEAKRIAEEQAVHVCRRCSAKVGPDEFARSQRAFQRVFCDKCFDEVYLERRNFDAKVELNKTIETKDGTFVQSDGERRIAEFLAQHNISYRYDERFRILDEYAVRPDFYLPEFDLYIEYWGMDTADYKIGMLKKQKIYQQEGKRVISIYRTDKPHLENVLADKPGKYMRLPATSSTSIST